ncbi:MAG: hypothetical protein HYR70_13435 [Chloroflexi bacterium]|nr:hypothetical protein [Chloroflexota bacterium]MBI3339634.1 hypothetical protein [Chloroflexota bacterium]
MNRNKKSLGRIEDEIRRRYKEFWEQFSLEELQAVRDDNASPEVMARFDKTGDLFALYDAIMTPEERAEHNQIMKELEERNLRENVS